MTHTLARRTTAILLLGLAATSAANALPALPALPTPPMALDQDLQTPVGGARVGMQDQAIDACANVAAPALPALPIGIPTPAQLPVPSVSGADACVKADLAERYAGLDANAGPVGVHADSSGQADIAAGPVKTHTETPLDAFIGWLTSLF